MHAESYKGSRTVQVLVAPSGQQLNAPLGKPSSSVSVIHHNEALQARKLNRSVQRGPSCHVGTTSTPPHPRLLSTPKRPPPPLSAYLEPQGFGGLWLGSGIDEWRSCTTPSVQGPPMGDVSRYLDGRWWVNLVTRGVGLVRVRHGSSSSPAAVWSMIADFCSFVAWIFHHNPLPSLVTHIQLKRSHPRLERPGNASRQLWMLFKVTALLACRLPLTGNDMVVDH
ncbi:hypothetical protein J3F84DRAFT_57437 [Trichoderma pleuroticola]